MKKVALLILVLAGIFSMYACTEGGENNVPVLRVENFYSSTTYSSFARLQVNRVHDELYANDSKLFIKYLLVECTVLEDYYDRLEAGQVIQVPIMLGVDAHDDDSIQVKHKCLDADVVKEFLENHPQFIARLARIYEANYLYSVEAGAYVWVEELSVSISLGHLQLIPLSEDAVDFTALDLLLENAQALNSLRRYIKGYDQVVAQGMPADTVGENLRSLYQYQLEAGKIIG
ncbi:MAG: hypothetical protein WDA00_07030 [Eubacteriales bacterium]